MTTSSLHAFHAQMQHLFTQTADRAAKTTGFVRRQSPITGSLFLQALVWTVYCYGSISLSRLVDTAEDLDPSCQVSEQAFDARFTAQAVAFMQAMLAHSLQCSLPDSSAVVPLLETFSAVYILDSSTVSWPESLGSDFVGCGGDSSSAAVKLYLLINWLNPCFEALELRDGKKADQDMGREFLADRLSGALWMFDLGFWSVAFVSAIAVARSYFLCRLQSQVSLYIRHEDGLVENFDLDQFLKCAPTETIFEVAVVLGAKEQVDTRLVVARVPPQVAAQRRRALYKARGKKGRTPTQKSLRRCDWTLMVTNAPCEMLPTSAVATVYRVRWQVELVFKLAKGEAALDQTTSEKRERVLCELYAKLIALCCFGRLLSVVQGSTTQVISAVKAWRRMKEKVLVWGSKLRVGEGVKQLQVMVLYLQRRAQASKRSKYPSTRQRVEQAIQQPKMCRLVDPLGYVRSKGLPKSKEAQVDDFFEHSFVELAKAA